ncbi:hypothetical protein REPUB_Repub07fG0209100 [Reevesia pubescens]
MKFVCSWTLARIILCVVAILFVKSLSTSIFKLCNLEIFYSSLSQYILFNAIIIAVIFGSHKPSIDEFDGVYPYLHSLYEADASFDNTEEYSDVDVYEDDICSSNGYQEDDDEDDDDNDDMNDGWDDEEEDGDDLQKRIEDFIAEVTNGWREERLKEKD